MSATDIRTLDLFDLGRSGVAVSDWSRLASTVKSFTLVSDTKVDTRGIMAVTVKLDGIHADRIDAKIEFLTDQINSTIQHRAGRNKIQTSTGRGVGGGGYI